MSEDENKKDDNDNMNVDFLSKEMFSLQLAQKLLEKTDNFIRFSWEDYPQLKSIIFEGEESVNQTVRDLSGLKAKYCTTDKKIPLNIGIVGVAKAGKSTFLNAIVGNDVSPSRLIPMTFIPSKITHEEGVKIPKLFIPNTDIINQAQNEVWNILHGMKKRDDEVSPQSDVDDKFSQQSEVKKLKSSYPTLSDFIDNLITLNEAPVGIEGSYEGIEIVSEKVMYLNDFYRFLAMISDGTDEYKKLMTADMENALEYVVSSLENVPYIKCEFAIDNCLKKIVENQNIELSFIDFPGTDENSCKLLLQAMVYNIFKDEHISGMCLLTDVTKLNTAADGKLKDWFLDKLHIDPKLKLCTFAIANKVDQAVTEWRIDDENSYEKLKDQMYYSLQEMFEKKDLMAVSARPYLCAKTSENLLMKFFESSEYQDQSFASYYETISPKQKNKFFEFIKTTTGNDIEKKKFKRLENLSWEDWKEYIIDEYESSNMPKTIEILFQRILQNSTKLSVTNIVETVDEIFLELFSRVNNYIIEDSKNIKDINAKIERLYCFLDGCESNKKRAKGTTTQMLYEHVVLEQVLTEDNLDRIISTEMDFEEMFKTNMSVTVKNIQNAAVTDFEISESSKHLEILNFLDKDVLNKINNKPEIKVNISTDKKGKYIQLKCPAGTIDSNDTLTNIATLFQHNLLYSFSTALRQQLDEKGQKIILEIIKELNSKIEDCIEADKSYETLKLACGDRRIKDLLESKKVENKTRKLSRTGFLGYINNTEEKSLQVKVEKKNIYTVGAIADYVWNTNKRFSKNLWKDLSSESYIVRFSAATFLAAAPLSFAIFNIAVCPIISPIIYQSSDKDSFVTYYVEDVIKALKENPVEGYKLYFKNQIKDYIEKYFEAIEEILLEITKKSLSQLENVKKNKTSTEKIEIKEKLVKYIKPKLEEFRTAVEVLKEIKDHDTDTDSLDDKNDTLSKFEIDVNLSVDLQEDDEDSSLVHCIYDVRSNRIIQTVKDFLLDDIQKNQSTALSFDFDTDFLRKYQDEKDSYTDMSRSTSSDEIIQITSNIARAFNSNQLQPQQQQQLYSLSYTKDGIAEGLQNGIYEHMISKEDGKMLAIVRDVKTKKIVHHSKLVPQKAGTGIMALKSIPWTGIMAVGSFVFQQYHLHLINQKLEHIGKQISVVQEHLSCREIGRIIASEETLHESMNLLMTKSYQFSSQRRIELLNTFENISNDARALYHSSKIYLESKCLNILKTENDSLDEMKKIMKSIDIDRVSYEFTILMRSLTIMVKKSIVYGFMESQHCNELKDIIYDVSPSLPEKILFVSSCFQAIERFNSFTETLSDTIQSSFFKKYWSKFWNKNLTNSIKVFTQGFKVIQRDFTTNQNDRINTQRLLFPEEEKVQNIFICKNKDQDKFQATLCDYTNKNDENQARVW